MYKKTQNLKGNYSQILQAVVVISVFLIILLRAWISDDAYITLRTVDNLINGYGLTWNVNERVEVFTHPLWMLLLSFFYFFTHEAYLTTIFVSLSLVIFTLIYLQKKIKPLSHLILVFLALGLSNAFVDYATSGLENVLNYTLFTIFFFQFFGEKEPKDNYLKIVFLAGLIGMTRLDLLLMILPLLVYVFFQQSNKWQAIKTGFLALSPLIIWEIFSYLYYGYMFPNTYYAKVFSGLPHFDILIQGLHYFVASLKRDPLTILVLIFSIFYGLFSKNAPIKLISFGLLLYLIYIVNIGGDFMVGRFITTPYIISVLVLSQTLCRKLDLPKTIITGIFLFIMGFISPIPTFQQLNPMGNFEAYKGIVDEREIYYYGTSLFRYGKFNLEPNLDWINDGRELKRDAKDFDYHVKPYLSVGFLGYFAGPNNYIIDRTGLGNAFLAHQPMNDLSDWRIGHYEREINEDYLESLKQNKNLIIDSNLRDLYEDVVIRTQNDVFETTRLRYILNLQIFN